ncbi:MAG: PAS domain-containing protein [Nitrospirota bacterium]
MKQDTRILAPRDKSIKMLLIEDNRADALLIQAMLNESSSVSIDVTHVDTLAKAQSLARDHYDILLLDLSLPDGSGLETLTQMCTAFPDIPIVILSGLGDEELALNAVKEGAQDYLLKGRVDSDMLIRSIRYAIERKQSEELLRNAYDELELRVQERTAELLEANRALQKSERKYRMLIEQASDGIFICDADGNITDVNSTLCQMLGFTRDELLRFNLRDIIPEKDLLAVPLRINEVLSGEKIVIERRLLHKNRSYVYVELSAKMIEDGRLQTIVRDLSERIKAAEVLRRSEASLAEAQRIAHIGNWEWHIGSNELYWSDEIYRIFGLSPQGFGATYEAFLNSVHPDDRELVERAVNEALYGKQYNISHRIVLPDGTVRFVHEQGKVTFGESGEPVRMFGTVQDITEQKMVEEELRQSNERYQRMINAITSYTYSVELEEERVISTRHSMGCLAITGYSPYDYEADPHLWYSMIYPVDRKVVEGSIKDIMSGKKIAPIEHRLIRRDGTTVWVRNTIVPHYDQAQKLVRYDGLIENITERKEAERALQDSRAKYAAIVEGFDGFIYICSEEDVLEFMNGRLKGKIGRDATGEKCYTALREFEKLCSWLEKGQVKEQIIRGEFHNSEDNRWYYVIKSPIYNQDGSISRMIMMQDITEKKENEIRLILSEKLVSLGQMASGIAHEINNPLATISASAEGLLGRLRRNKFDPELFENYLKIINEEVIRCKGITTNMLSFVRKTSYEKRDIDLNAILDKTLELIEFQGRLKDVEVVKNYEGQLIINASEGELRQILLSIIMNALDAMEDKGTLILESGIEHEHAVIKISDTGSGISADHLTKIFDPFFTTRSEKGGTGLGLAISKKIITDNKGDIEVFSEKGKGTTFKITLPV